MLVDTPSILAWLDCIFGIAAGLYYLRNATRRMTDMDIRKRGLRIIKGLAMITLGLVYLLLAAGYIDLTQDYMALAVRTPLWVLFAAALGYAFIER